MSCYRDLNPGPLPYQGSALPLSYNSKENKSCGQRWIRTTEGVSQQIYSLPHLATLVFALWLSSYSGEAPLFLNCDAKIRLFL